MAGIAQDAVDFEALHRRLDEAEARLSGDLGGEERRRRVLSERARAIAGSREAAPQESVAVLVFVVGGERYAVDVDSVSQVIEARGLHPLLASPPWLLGAITARTRVVPVLDLRQLLGLQGGGMSDLGKVIVVEHEGDVFGIAAEVLEGRLEVARDGLTELVSGPFVWVARDRLALLDLAQLGAPAGKG